MADPRDQSIGELVKDLAGETSTLVRQEIDLAKAEMTERGKQIGKGAGILGAAALVGLLAAGALTAASSPPSTSPWRHGWRRSS